MNKTTVLTAVFCLLLSVGAVFAQKAAEPMKTTNYAGNWDLDVGKSKLDDRMKIESMTMNVSQTDKELKVDSTTKRPARAVESTPGAEAVNGGGMKRGGMMGGMDGTQSVAYSLDGKETKLATPGIPGADATLQAKFDKDGKLKLTTTRVFNGQTGEMKMTTNETWELLDGGKTLKVTRETDTPRGKHSAEMVFTKKQ